MSEFNVVVSKLLKLKEYIEQLEKVKPKSYDEYTSDITIKYTVERIIQLIVDVALDLNNIVLAYMKKPPAADYFNSFIDLSVCGVLDNVFATSIAPSTGLRNRLVHEYEEINNEIVFNSIDRVIDMYKEYLVLISKFIKEHE